MHLRNHFCLFIGIIILAVTDTYAAGFEHFITRDGYRLMEGDREFRFLAFNIPNLNYVEDEMAFDHVNPYRLPTAFEIRDAMESVKQMGRTVIRNYTFPVRRLSETPEVPAYVLAPGLFSERAFVTMDTVLALANETGVRLILPLVNAWQWMGGRPQYAAFRGKTEEEFWTDPELIADFKETIHFILTRINTVTGVPYRDDKAILCWETGNELFCPHSWTQIVTAYIKELDPNHLVMDAYHAIDIRPVREESVAEPSVDIVTSHHYAKNVADVLANIRANLAIVKGRKPYIIGEFGFLKTEDIAKVLELISGEPQISGGLIWSLRYHRQEGGFYWHSEPFGHGLYKAYHWPGFASGDEYDEREVLALMRKSAFAIQGKLLPDAPVPDAPHLLPIDHVTAISWRGSVGASGYDVERSESVKGPWISVGENVSDAAVQYRPLFHDGTAEIGKSYYYRIIAQNNSGRSVPSNIVGPVDVVDQALVDEMQNFDLLYFRTGALTLQTNDDRKFKEDLERIQGQTGDEIVYQTPGPIRRIRIYAFSESEASSLSLSLSRDNQSYETTPAKTTGYFAGKGDYAYWVPVLYELNESKSLNHYLKIEFAGTTQISRIEIFYGE